MLRIGQALPQTSLKSFLADTAISVFLCTALAISNVHTQKALHLAQDNGHALLLGVLVVLLLYPMGLVINGFSYFSLSAWVLREERALFRNQRRFRHTKIVFDFEKMCQVFAIKRYADYRRRVTMLEELEFVFNKYDAGQGHTSGLEQFLRNIASMAPFVALMYIPQVAEMLNLNRFVSMVTTLAASGILAMVVVKFCAMVRLYRGLFYLSAIFNLNMYVCLVELPDACNEDDGIRVLYEAIHRLLSVSERGIAT